MMRYTLITVLVAILALTAAGPATSQPAWNFELVAGVDFTQLTGDDTDATLVFNDPDIGSGEVSGDIGGMKVGFTVGGLFTVDVNDNFAVQSGLLWSRKGSDGDVTLQGDIPGLGVVDLTANVTMTLDYVEVPILGVLSFPAGPSMRFRAMAGPVLSFKSNAEIDVEVAGYSQSEDFGDEVKSVDVGGLIGVGLVIPAGALNFNVDARYTMGFTSIDDSDSDLDIKNSAIAVTAALGIPLTR
jgi:hypothetical protein